LGLWKENVCYTKIGNVKWRTTIEDDNKVRCRDLTSHNLPQLTLDNLFPWLDIAFEEVENPEYTIFEQKLTLFYDLAIKKGSNYFKGNGNKAQVYFQQGLLLFHDNTLQSLADLGVKLQPKTLADKLKNQATTLYFSDPAQLADLICEAIKNNF
jgi:hypothetical protein